MRRSWMNVYSGVLRFGGAEAEAEDGGDDGVWMKVRDRTGLLL